MKYPLFKKYKSIFEKTMNHIIDTTNAVLEKTSTSENYKKNICIDLDFTVEGVPVHIKVVPTIISKKGEAEKLANTYNHIKIGNVAIKSTWEKSIDTNVRYCLGTILPNRKFCLMLIKKQNLFEKRIKSEIENALIILN